MVKGEELKKLRKEVKDILAKVCFSKIVDCTKLVNKCIKIGKIKARRDFADRMIEELKQEVIRVNKLKKLSGSNKEHLTHEARGYSRAIIILEKELKP